MTIQRIRSLALAALTFFHRTASHAQVSVGIAVLVLTIAAVPAAGQTGSFVIEGDIASGQTEDFFFVMFANFNKNDHVLQFSTAQGPGATPLLDTVLTLFDPASTQIATNDDIGGGSLFSRLSWDTITPNNPPSSVPIPSPLAGGQLNEYKLRLSDFGNDNAGSWRLQIDASIDFSLQEIGSGSSTIRSLSMNSADFSSFSSLNITGPLQLTGTMDGPARVAPINGTFTVGGITTLTDSRIQVFGGSFVANNNVTISGGQIAEIGGDFQLAANKTLTASAFAHLLLGAHEINDGKTYSLSTGADLEVSGALYIGGNGSTGTLNVDGTGSTVSTTALNSWGFSDGTANVTFSGGASATLAGVALGGSFFSGDSKGTWNIQSGATATSSGNVSIGSGASGGASLNVTGASSKLTLTGAAQIDIGGFFMGSQPASVNVTSNGELVTGTGTSGITSLGTLNITTGGKVTANGDMTVNGGKILRDSTSTFTLAAGKTLTANNNATVTMTGGFTINGGSIFAPTKVVVNSGSDFSTAGSLFVGSTTVGTLEVAGGGSSVETGTGQTFIGINGGTGAVTIRDGATANFGPTLSMSFSPFENSDGTLNVNTGGHVTVGTINMAGAGRPNSDAVINLVGNGSFNSAVIEQTMGSTLTVGSNGQGSATINLSGNAEFYGNGATTTVLATGTINNTNGRFRVGDLTVDGGTFDSVEDLVFGDLTAKNDADVRLQGFYTPDFADPIVVESGADLEIDNYISRDLSFNPGAFEPAVLTIEGLGSSYTGNFMALGDDNGADDEVTVRNRATAQIDHLSMGLAGTSSFVVQGLASVTVGDLGIANGDSDPDFNASGTFEVSGGSQITQTGASGLFIGNSILGSGTLDVQGSTFTTGTGTIAINPTGSMVIAPGVVDDGVNDPTFVGSVFNANGNIIVLGGSLNVDGASTFNQAANKSLTASQNAQLTFGNGYAIPSGGSLNIQTSADVAISGALTIASTGTANLTDGTLSFGSTTLAEFARISATGGALAGNVTNAAFVNVATLTTLQNTAVDLTGIQLINSGTLFGNAALLVGLTNNSNGEVETVTGERMRFADGPNTNFGDINLFGGQVRFGGTFTNESDGFIGGRGQVIGDSGLTNKGMMTFSGGATDIVGDLTNSPGGQIITTGNGVTTFFDDVIHNGAEVRTSGGSETVFLGSVSGAGPFTGTGAVRFEGDHHPGNSPAVVSYEGDVAFGQDATTHIEIAGLAPGQYDRLDIAGDLDLGGGLLVSLIDEFTLGAGEEFLIVDVVGTREGTFAGLMEGSSVGTFGERRLQITYAAGDGNDIGLYAVAVPEPSTITLCFALLVALMFFRGSRRAA